MSFESERRDKVVSEALAAYDLTSPVVSFALSRQGGSNASIGLHTAAGDFVWKTHTLLHSTASIRYEQHLMTWLATQNLSFAVPAALPTRNGALLVNESHGPTSLTRHFPGTHLDPQQPEQTELYGAAIGELQAALEAYPPAPRPDNPVFASLFDFPPPEREPLSLTPAQLGLADTQFHNEMLHVWRMEAATLAAFVAGPYGALPHQVCHNDMTPANVLVHERRVSAVLDFEFACPTPRALDLAMGLRMTSRVWEDPQPWELFRHFMRGYQRWVQLTDQEVCALPLLLRLRAAIPVLWWLGHTPTSEHIAAAVRGMGYLRLMVDWLAQCEQQFIEVMSDVKRKT